MNTISLRGSFSKSYLFHFPRQLRALMTLKPSQNPRKRFDGYLSRLRSACYAFDESPGQVKKEGNLNGIRYKHLIEERKFLENCQSYLRLLEYSLKFGSFLECKTIHGKILKVGFGGESVLCDMLMDVYIAVGDLDGVVKVLDDMPKRSVLDWNKALLGFVAKKMSGRALELFRQMVEALVNPNDVSFSGVLRACGSADAAFCYVEQIHAKIIHHGYETSLISCNPLVDSYAKNGFITSAKKVFDSLLFKDNVSWVAMTSGFSQNGFEEEAVSLFCEMHISGTFPTPYVFSSVLSACTKIKLFDVGEQLHALIFKWGFFQETYVSNALIALYSRSDNFISAGLVFSKMWCKDEVSYNSLISGLAQQGFNEKALELFELMQLDCLKPDSVTIASLLGACASTGAFCTGEKLHGYVIKAGMSKDIIIEGSLLDLYVNYSDMKTARKLFLTTQTENLVLWNVLLVAYGNKDNLNESYCIFRQMQIEGLMPDQFTYPSIIRTCTSSGALELGEQIHTQVVKSGFQFNLYVCSVLIDMYAKLGKLDAALEILRRLPDRDVVTWTAMIAGYTKHDWFHEALNLFQEMQNRGIQSDNIGYLSAITACAGIQALKQGQQIHAQIFMLGYSDDLSIGALVSLYARCGRIKEAYLAFERLHAKDSVSWNGLISGFAQSGYCEEAFKVFAQMNRNNLEASLFTFGSVVSAAANMASIKLGKQIHATIIKKAFDSEIEVSNALVSLYAKCGSIDDAKREFYEMPEKNEISWNAMITGFSQHGCGDEAVNLFERMKQSGETPNDVTFLGVLSACSHVGLVNKGLGYFESMSKDHGLVPKSEHYACVVDLLSRDGSLINARKFIDKMPIKPDAWLWRSLLSSCIIHKNMDVGEFAACHLLELEPEDSGTYVLLSNMYAEAGKWECMDQARQMMKGRGVKKEPGRSWI